MATNFGVPYGRTLRASPAAYDQGDVEWLQNTAFIPASCFQPPRPSSAQPRGWDRVAVPASTSRHTESKIYKRVGALVHVDNKYLDAVNELESQGFGSRKRVRSQTHIPPYGNASSEREDESQIPGEQELSTAREQVRNTLLATSTRETWEEATHNDKQPTFDPAQLIWIPRKRHNTRWPIDPPGEASPLIAELQPFVKFELHPSQIDEPAFFEQLRAEKHRYEQAGLSAHDNEQPPTVPPSPRVSEPGDMTRKMQPQKPGQRRRTLRPRLSLSTISEVTDEPSLFQVMTPGPKNRRASLASFSRSNAWSAATDKMRSPLKATRVAESPLRNFSMTNANCDTNVTSPTRTLSALDCIEEGQDDGLIALESYNQTRDTHIEITYKNATNPEAAVAIFDQPSAPVPEEPKHEFKRRISLNNARRSDRRSSIKILRRVSNYMLSTAVGQKRRHSDFTQSHGASRTSTRRHTLDVDAGRNLDIFGQTSQETGALTAEEIGVSQDMPQRLLTRSNDTQVEKRLSGVRSMAIDQGEMTGLSTSQNVDQNDPTAAQHEMEIDGDVPGTTIVDDDDESTTTAQSDEENRVSESPGGSSAEGANVPEYTKIEQQPENVDVRGDEGDHAAILKHEADPTVETCPNNTREMSSSPEEDLGPMITRQVQQKVEIAAAEEVNGIMDDIMSQIGDRVEGQATHPGSANGEDNVDGDSDLADLLSFVRRNKERKGGQAASIMPPTRPKKRRSGSMSSATSETGSPMSRAESASAATSPRVPLGAKDANKSPSPIKRKLKAASDAPLKKTSRLVAPDLEDTEPTKPKKRRKKMESDTDDIFNPEMGMGQDLTQRGLGGPRRSTRVATTKKTSATVTPSSSIPVRLGALADLDLPAPSATGLNNAVLQKKAAAELRANTQKNKGGAIPPAMVLAALAESVEDETATPPTLRDVEVITRPRGSKTVRWDEILARVQGENSDEAASDDQTVEEKKLDDVEVEEEEAQLPSPPQLRIVADHEDERVQPEHEKKQAATAPRRSTRSAAASRLPTRGGSVPSAATPKKSGLPAPSKAARGETVSRGVRRGMSGPGTPAPRRGGRRV